MMRSPTSLSGLSRMVRARFAVDARLRVGVVAAAVCLTPVFGLGLFGDPARAYAVARLSLPEVGAPSALAGMHAEETHTERGLLAGVAEPREFLRAAASAPAAPRPVLRPTRGEPTPHADPVMALRPAEDPAVAPRLAGVDDLGAGGRSLAAAPARTGGSGSGLTPAPIEALARTGPGGLLPRVAPDGDTPAHAYARPFEDRGESPLVAIVIGGLGLNAAITREAIETLPPEVTLSFVPYAERLQDWIDAAREAGHEVVLELPMEPYDYPANDPGPHTLLARADAVENQRRLEWLMSRGSGYFAVMNYLGARFTAENDALAAVFDRIGEMGVAFLYDGETERSELARLALDADLPAATADRILDAQPRAATIDGQLLQLEALAIQNGDAMGAGFGYPVTVRQVRAWSNTLELKGYRLAPASAVLARRAARAEMTLAATPTESPTAQVNFSRMAASFGSGGAAGAGGAAGHGEPSGGH